MCQLKNPLLHKINTVNKKKTFKNVSENKGKMYIK